MKNYSSNGTIKNLSFPRVIQIAFDGDNHLVFSEDVITKVKQLQSYIPDLNESKIYLGFCDHATPEEEPLLLQLQNIYYYYYQISKNTSNLLKENFSDANGQIVLRDVNYPNTYNDLLEKVYRDECIVYYAQNFCQDDVIWNIPSCIKTLKISNSRVVSRTPLPTSTFLFNMNNIINKLEELHIRYCKNINIQLTTSTIHTLKINNSTNVELKGNLENVTQLYISYSKQCTFPKLTFDNKNVFIENSEISFSDKSVFDFLNFKLSKYKKLANSCLDLPYRSNQTLMYRPRRFTTFSSNLKIENDSFINKNCLPLDPVAQLISNSFYDEFSSKNQIIWSNGKQIQVPALIHYFEVEIFDYAVVAIGLYDRINYMSQQHEEDTIGWDDYSIAYHSDDGHLYFGQGIGNPYGPIYGEDDKKHVVGCGFNTKTKEIFFCL
ncbi:B30.2/SPRY domain-containing protein [Entamoeba marina]